jgi:prevent-host-death family protein
VDVKKVSIQDLKPQLSSVVAEAEQGGTIVITRHGKPVARLVPADPPYVHRGPLVGTPLPAALETGIKGLGVRALELLLEDRGDR